MEISFLIFQLRNLYIKEFYRQDYYEKKYIILLSLLVLIVGLSTISAAEVDNSNQGLDVASDQSHATSQEATTNVADNCATSSASAQGDNVASTSDTRDVSTSSATNDVKTSNDVSTSTPAKEVTTKDTTATSTQKEVSTNTVDTNKNVKTVVDTNDNVKTESTQGTTYTITDKTSLDNVTLNDYDTLDFEGEFNDFTYTVDKNITFTSNGNNANFYDSTITLTQGASGTTISNLKIDNSNSANALVIESGVDNLIIKNNEIILYSDTTTLQGISLENSDNSQIIDNRISLSSPAVDINYIYSADWSIYEGRVETFGIGVFSSSNILIEGNIIDVSNTIDSSSIYSTLTGIAVQGSPVNGVTINNITIKGNKVNVKNDYYAYGITLQYNAYNSLIQDNNVTSIDNTGSYICGIQASDETENTTISNNTVNITASEDTYGINVIGSLGTYNHDVTVSNNNIAVYGDRIRGIELYFVRNINVEDNTITAIGNYANGIGLGAVETSTISNNLIITEGQYFDMYPQGWYEGQDGDEIGFITGGIYITSADNWMSPNETCDSFGNDIIGNSIYTNGVYTVNGTGYDNLVTENYLEANGITGDYSVGLDQSDNWISNNHNYNYDESLSLMKNDMFSKRSGDATFFPYLLRNH